jgi:hypothetical protein
MTARYFPARHTTLLAREHAALADFLVALGEFDRQRLWAELGHANLFDFLHRRLGLSRGAAHYRKTAAALVQRYPTVLAGLREGRLCITSIIELAKVITPQNHQEIVPRFFGCSRQEAMAVAAAINPMEAAPRRAMVTAIRPQVPAGAAPLISDRSGAVASAASIEIVLECSPRTGASSTTRPSLAQPEVGASVASCEPIDFNPAGNEPSSLLAPAPVGERAEASGARPDAGQFRVQSI